MGRWPLARASCQVNIHATIVTVKTLESWAAAACTILATLQASRQTSPTPRALHCSFDILVPVDTLDSSTRLGQSSCTGTRRSPESESGPDSASERPGYLYLNFAAVWRVDWKPKCPRNLDGVKSQYIRPLHRHSSSDLHFFFNF